MSSTSSLLELILNQEASHAYGDDTNYTLQDETFGSAVLRNTQSITNRSQQLFAGNGVGYKAIILAYQDQGLTISTTGRTNTSGEQQKTPPVDGILGSLANGLKALGFSADAPQVQALSQINILNGISAHVWIPTLDRKVPEVYKTSDNNSAIGIKDLQSFPVCKIDDERLVQSLPPIGSLVVVDYENRETKSGLTLKYSVCTDASFARIIMTEFTQIDISDIQFKAVMAHEIIEDSSFDIPQGDPIPATPPRRSDKCSSTPATAADINNAYWQIKAVPGWADKIVLVANRLRIPDPGWLANVMYFETGADQINPYSKATPKERMKTFDPSITNHIGATGLIQFMPSTATNLGTTSAALAAMDPLEQMDYVELYLQPYSGRMKTSSDLYMAIFLPVAVGHGPDYSIYDYHARNPPQRWEGRGEEWAEIYLAQNLGIRTAGDYQKFADRHAKLPVCLEVSS